MKVKELMIGDLIYLGNTHIKVEYDLFIAGHLTESYKPIPLTEDILEANGFNKVHHAGTGATEEYDDYITNGFLCCHMTEDWKDTHFCIPDTGIKFLYVHELQHVLRLSGLNKLADNFIIKKEIDNGKQND